MSNTNKPIALVQLLSSERVIGGLLLVGLLALAFVFAPAFQEYQQELITILTALIIQFAGWHTYVKWSAGGLVLSQDTGNPLLEPFLKLLRSRKFMVTLIGLIFEGVAILVPIEEGVRQQVMSLILLLVTAYNGAISVEDVKINQLQEGEAPKALAPQAGA